jgi:Secretion system C-terminal sorting domain
LGNGGQTPAQIEEAMGYLDRAFNKFEIYFLMDCNIEYIKSNPCSAYLMVQDPGYGTCISGADASNAINVYLFPDHFGNNTVGAAGALGYISTKLGIIGKIDTITDPSLSTVRSLLFAHEMGHCFGLYHTHYLTGQSFEGVGNCNGDPECVDGWNGAFAGDIVTDTPADPNLSPNPNGSNYSDVTLATCSWDIIKTEFTINCTGLQYAPDASNIMSYSWIQCYRGFSPNQGRRMRHHLMESTKLAPTIIQPEHISSNTTWTTVNTPGGIRLIDDVLIIDSSFTLSIDAGVTVKFSNQGRLIIMPGATLRLSGTLTGQTCSNSNTWKGVEIWGNSNATQIPANQGRFIGNSGAVIENADIALQTWGGDESLGSGGMIAAKGVSFLNCRTAVSIAPFISSNYQARFTNCTFKNTTGYLHNQPFRYFNILRGVRGILYSGCKFLNENVPASSGTPADFGYGIFAFDAGFSVGPDCSAPTSSCLRSKFEGLGYGIFIGTDKFAPIAHTIREADFTDCYVGIENSGVAMGTMVLNKFNLGSLPGADFIPGQLGVVMIDNLNGFTLEENEFIGTSSSVRTFGILCAQLGEFSNVVRRNKFTDVSLSNYALFKNAADGADIPRGLYYDCNTNIDVGEYDFNVFGTIRSEQGLQIAPTIYRPAGNKFSYTGSPSDRDFANPFGGVNYYYLQNTTNEQPIDFLGITPIQQATANGCEMVYCNLPCPEPHEGNIDTIKQGFHHSKANFLAAKANYESAIAHNEPAMAAQFRQEAGHYKQRMDTAAFAVLNMMLADTLNSYVGDSIRQWIHNLGTIGAELSRAGDFLAIGDLETASEIIEDIPENFSLSTAVESDIDQVKSLFEQLSLYKPYNLSRQTIQQLEVLALDTLGFAPPLARNLLRLNGRDFPPYILPEIGERHQPGKPNSTVGKLDVAVFPNPARDYVVFSSQTNLGIVFNITIYDPIGKVVWEYHGKKPEKQIIWELSSVPAGLYIYVLKGASDNVSGKVVIK